MPDIAIYTVSECAGKLATLIKSEIGGNIYSLRKYAATDATPFDSLSACVENTFTIYDGHIFIMAQGIVTRVIATCIKNKYDDPAVVVMDDAGRFAISYISGHEGGANLSKGIHCVRNAMLKQLACQPALRYY